MLRLVLLALLHPLHTTHTTITQGSANGCAIEIRAFTDDLQAALRRRGAGLSDSSVAQYLRATVSLVDPRGRPAALHWVGQSPDGDVTQLRFACVLPAPMEAMSVRQGMQLELYADQVNVVQVRMAQRRVSLLFTPGDMAKPVR